MTRAALLTNYVRMIEDFLAHRTTAKTFSGAFFRAFQADSTRWGASLYEALNAVAMLAEGYELGAPLDEFDVTEAQLREGCHRRLAELRAAQASARDDP